MSGRQKEFVPTGDLRRDERAPKARASRAALIAMWLFAFGLYGAYFQGQWIYGERPIYSITGDEPHYLIIATSLWRDHDLDILNNYRDKDYHPFYPYHLGDARDPEDMHALYGRGGRLYSKHGLGLPVLLLPVFGPGGHGPARVFMMALTALLAVQTYLLALQATGKRVASLVAWAAVAFSAPLLLYADQFYPEVPGALLLVAGLRAVLAVRPTAGNAAVLGAAIGLLPWFHLRYVPLAAILALTALVRYWPLARRWALLRWSALPPALVGLALLVVDWRLFGGIPRVDEYGTVSLFNVLVGLPGLLLDRQFGLLVYAPVFVVALFGLPLVPRARFTALGWLVPSVCGVYFLFIGSFSYWYGAFSPPARMLVPVVPVLVVPLALALDRWRGIGFRLLATLLLVAGWSIAHLLMDVPRLRYNVPDGESQMLRYLSRVWGVALDHVLPSFVVPSAASFVWALGALALGALFWRIAGLPSLVDIRSLPLVRSIEGWSRPSTSPNHSGSAAARPRPTAELATHGER
ncbi:MAG: hypothetical protein HY332_24815 [Chloroflexi bacterium]|nr:hypothetical protein [Chloroflexota bacterium]